MTGKTVFYDRLLIIITDDKFIENLTKWRRNKLAVHRVFFVDVSLFCIHYVLAVCLSYLKHVGASTSTRGSSIARGF